MSWENWGPGKQVIVSEKLHPKFGEVGVISAHDPANNNFSVEFVGGETIFVSPHSLDSISNIEDSSVSRVNAVVEQAEIIESFGPQENATETLLRLASRECGVTIDQLCQERRSKVKGPYQRCINSNIRKNNIIEKEDGVFFTTGSVARKIIGSSKPGVTREDLAIIFENIARALRS